MMKFDNNDNDERKNSEKPRHYFLGRKGFYVILFLCVSIVVVTAMWGEEQNQNPLVTEEIVERQNEYQAEVRLVEDVVKKEEVVRKEEKANDEIAKIMTAKVDENPGEAHKKNEAYVEEECVSEEIATEENNNSKCVKNEDELVAYDETVPVMKEEFAQVMTMPVIGQVGLNFANDRLVYHKTLDHWSTHKGVDIHAKEGVPVRAALEGEVIEIINDTIMGITITIAHSGELVTQYSNLSTSEMVEIGESVEKGQIISGVGRSAASKLKEGALLHFQVIRNGENIDPQKFLVVNP
ncbi:MAG: peptidoglycan DD-metalloendopeptidase family protein [Alkaliphilus sp.]